jgi:propanol-preferring alcohol dehydrogenase
MKAMVLHQLAPLEANPEPLRLEDLPMPRPSPGEVILRLLACGVCHTELDEIEGRTPPARLPVILGHQAVGIVTQAGEQVRRLRLGDRVGVAWMFSACGECRYCRQGYENLCPEFRATGRDADGGYAEFMRVPEEFAYPIPDVFSPAEAAPLLCAGAIGYRSLMLTGLQDGESLGLTGFGASAHLVLLLARHLFPASRVFVFARSPREREFALSLGAAWTGDTADQAPELLRAVIDTTPAWKPIVEGMSNLEPGGRMVVNAIRKETGDQDQLLRLDYPRHLWMEKEIKSVANVCRQDVRRFLEVAAAIPIRPQIQEYALEQANRALMDVKRGGVPGAKVLRME